MSGERFLLYENTQVPPEATPVIIYGTPPQPRPTLTGEQIRWVQTILKVTSPEWDLKIDGLMGPDTRAALIRFQQRARRFHPHIIVDGLVNLQTTTALTQRALNHIAKIENRVYPAVLPLAVDGIMGPKTIVEIKLFQSTHHSGPVDGIVGPITRAAMVRNLLFEIITE